MTAGRCCGGCFIAVLVISTAFALFMWWFDSVWRIDEVGLF